MLVALKQIIKKAEAGHYAVGAFNTSNLEITLAVVRAAWHKKSPVILQTSESSLRYSSPEVIAGIIRNVAETIGAKVPIAIHLDHGHDLKIIKKCLDLGYSSVHMDASEKDWASNVRLSKKAAQLAHRYGAWLQAELGSILGKEGLVKLDTGEINIRDIMTDPQQARNFVKLTGLDILAVSVGTWHGSFRGREKVDQSRLKKIRTLTGKPLVLHGGSGLAAGVYRRAIQNGVRIINIDTDLRLAFKKALDLTKDPDLIDPRKILEPAVVAMQARVEKIMDVFGSSGRA